MRRPLGDPEDCPASPTGPPSPPKLKKMGKKENAEGFILEIGLQPEACGGQSNFTPLSQKEIHSKALP
jgi:hypothetical protein